ncbi:polyketide synthase [Pseudozyma hubeiensis SY62]|uniref:Polyketide synthase n=1 Tax=Pseudozyma hubeiensis (strain SY62) TaxID=1305764 RepID=R9P1E7_PSEHS|nr:polyketide synthase [Pseudozyma hubeiensis SY62]GAC94994.1 polyketide synthase [Pseudozyma hubeiensis SY62]
MSSDSTFSSFDNVGSSNVTSKVATPSTTLLPRASVIVFGSQGSDFLSAFDNIFVLSRYYPELSTFLTLALAAVRAEIESVASRHSNTSTSNGSDPIGQRRSEVELLACLPPIEPFTDLKALVEYHRRNQLKDPVINGVLLCLLQTASVVAVYCVVHDDRCCQHALSTSTQLKQAWKALTQPRSHLLGYCTGVLPAFSLRRLAEDDATACNVDIWNYTKDALRAIRICFWIGLRSAHARLRIVQADDLHNAIDQYWSFFISVKDTDYLEKVELRLALFNGFETQRPLDECLPLVVSAKQHNQISITGPPRTLKRFEAYLMEHLGSKCKTLPLKLFAPYHTPALAVEADSVMLDLESRGLIDDSMLPPSSKTVWETAGARVLSQTSLRGASRILVDSNLCAPADWESMIDRLVALEAELPRDMHSEDRIIVSICPGASLGADIRTRLSGLNNMPVNDGSVVHVDVNMLLSKQSSSLMQAIPTVPLPPQPDVDGEEVVVVSMSCRFPGDVRTPDQLWTCLETGRSTVAEIPKHLFDIDAYYGQGLNQTLARHMHALPEHVVKSMDARLFSMSPKEMEQLDPQHRLVMLCSYEALERAGYSAEANSPSSFDGKRIAVCMAASWDDYRENASWNIGSYFITGNIRAFIPGHVSFSLKWEGPSISVDSLECSAVSALQWSRRALLSGQCDVALAGAVNVLTQPQMFIAMDKQGILSRSGTNATFSSRHDGKTRGDGCGVMLLKRRSTALRDGDEILATLPAARTTYHGRNHEQEQDSASQSRFLARVMSEAGVCVTRLVHIEAAGHHTQQGEAAEFESFSRLSSQDKANLASRGEDRISVASSRPNIGAGEAVSAMASVMKAVLMIQRGSVPRQISILEPSELQLSIAKTCAESPLFVPTQARSLPHGRNPSDRCIILVNSLASTDCHGVVLVGEPTLDEAPQLHIRSTIGDKAARSLDVPAWAFVLSAKTRESAEVMKQALIDYLQREVNLADLSYSLTCRRTHHPFRLSVVASDKDDLIRRLRTAAITEAKTQADLPPLGLHLQDLTISSDGSVKGAFSHTLALQDYLEDLPAIADHSETCSDAEKQFVALQACLALLLDDCGVHPSFVSCTKKLKHIIYRLFPTAKTDDTSESYFLVRIGPLISVSSDTSEDHAKLIESTDYAQRLQTSLISTLAALHQQGYSIQWIEFFRPHLGSLSLLKSLPTYSFSLQQYWMDYHDRNLLPRPASREDGLTGSVEPSANTTYDPPTQPLLDQQTSADEGSITYRSYATSAVLSALLEKNIHGAVIVELMTEAIREASQSMETMADSADHPFLCLKSPVARDEFRSISDIDDLSISVNIVASSEDRITGQVEVTADPSRALVGRLVYDLISREDMSRRWTCLQKLLPEKVSRLKDEGELFSSKLVYISLQANPATATKSIQRAHSDRESCEAVVCHSVQPDNSWLLVERNLVLFELFASLEESARWFVNDTTNSAGGKLTFIGFDEILIRGDWLSSLQRPTGSTGRYTVHISHSPTAESPKPPTAEAPELDILILDHADEIVGELIRFRLAKRFYEAKKPVSKVQAKVISDSAKNAAAAKEILPQIRASPSTAANTLRTRHTDRAAGLHAKVLDVLASELGIGVEEMKPSVKFADLGLDSLMSLVCISTLETLNLGFDIPQSLFMEYDSPVELLQFIRGHTSESTEAEEMELEQGATAFVDREEHHSGQATPPLLSRAAVTTQQGLQSGSSAVEKTVKAIRSTIETELGVDEGSIGPDANLADLGMDSLMALLVLGNLSGTLPFELPSSLFMDCTSLREIDTFVTTQLGGATGAAPSATVNDAAPVALVAFTLPPIKNPILLRNSTKSASGPPLFLLPEGAGMATIYQLLPAIDRPIYSINSPFLGDAFAWTGGIAQIAQYYLASIETIQPVGPWLLGGWSFGGMAAFEIARHLASIPGADNDRVAGLFILDSPSPQYPPLPMSILDWIKGAPEVKDIAPPTMSAKLIAHFKATVDSLIGWKPNMIGTQSKALKTPPKTWYIVADDPLPGNIEDIEEINETVRWLFRPNRARTNGADGWQEVIPGEEIEVVSVANANHFTMVREPAASQVADVLQDACRKALLG